MIRESAANLAIRGPPEIQQCRWTVDVMHTQLVQTESLSRLAVTGVIRENGPLQLR